MRIYVEGGGDSKELHVRCREGFRKLIERAGFRARMPGIVACGGRGATYSAFRTAMVAPVGYPVLLVDSEDSVPETAQPDDPDSSVAWEHLRVRDRWERPAGVENDQAQLMVTCMETWIMADYTAMRTIFGANLQENALFAVQGLEQRDRHALQERLEHATRNCGRDRAYTKGRRSFQVLAALSPETLEEHLPYFRRFIATLSRHLR